MKRWLPGLLVLALAAQVAVPIGAAAQGKDTLTVALPSHAPTLDPHMHFERVGILVPRSSSSSPRWPFPGKRSATRRGSSSSARASSSTTAQP